MPEEIIEAPVTQGTYFLHFDNEEHAYSVFVSNGVELVDEKLPSTATIDGVQFALDVVFGNGIVYTSTGVMLTDEEGNEYPETAPVAGFHVNVSAMPDVLREFMLDPQPSYPKCVFA